ncbi:hypothetical protein [Acidovorax sp. PRC11]|uniref:hypothetical protein n=1 Tax=Acidovorax sp. PRC11 TaxID=2962592 RepID=UPI00288202A9|nr:hypothetical protein [Acidovorax sp. PRC11]MDT0137235.1 hypothetical protein [Acidovorax sp. PRC11]
MRPATSCTTPCTRPPPVTPADLERASGQDRWRLSLDFRALYGTSPYRYLLLRRHADTDEAFIVMKGELRIDRTGPCTWARAMFVVPRGTRQGEVWLMLVEPRGVLNTGGSGGERTAANDIRV